MPTLAAGDVRRGQLVFHSEKAACYSCHAIGYRGGNVGPDLTRIGSVRSDRDLLEAILFPSASLVRSFEPVAIATRDGKVYNGLIRGEDADELVLATGANQARADHPPRDRGAAPQHGLGHASGAGPAIDSPGARRPHRLPEGLPLTRPALAPTDPGVAETPAHPRRYLRVRWQPGAR